MDRDDDEDGTFEAMRFEVGPDDAGTRVDAWLPKALPGVSRARARFLADEGRVRLDGRPVRRGARLLSGARVEVVESPAAREALRALPEDDPRVRTVYEDAGLVVVDKPAGVPSVPLRPGEMGTVANVLAARYPSAVRFDPVEAGLLQRLDRDTSGLLAAGVEPDAYDLLLSLRREVGFEKGYLALVLGRPEPETRFDGFLAPTPGNPRKVRVVSGDLEGSRPAETYVEDVEPLPGGWSLVALRMITGGRHQIRAHLAHAGHPLAGDVLYGGPPVSGLGRHFLHAHELALPHPGGERIVRVTTPLPPELVAVLEAL